MQSVETDQYLQGPLWSLRKARPDQRLDPQIRNRKVNQPGTGRRAACRAGSKGKEGQGSSQEESIGEEKNTGQKGRPVFHRSLIGGEEPTEP